MRSRSFGLCFLLVALCGLILGCGKGASPIPAPNPGADAPADIGGHLYTPVAPPVYATVTRGEPLVIPNCTVQYEERQIVSAEVDGTIELFATPLKPGETVDRSLLVFHPRDLKKEVPMRRVSAGDDVETGQVLAFMDDSLIKVRMQGAKEIKAAAGEAKDAAEKGAEAAKKRLDLVSRAVGTGSSEAEKLDATITYNRFLENFSQATSTIAKTTADYGEAEVMLRKHQVRAGVKGFIRSISKRPGEYVKAGEKIMEIQATDRVRLEGNLDVQYAHLVKRGMGFDKDGKPDYTVIVEPALPSAPLKSHDGHRQGVTGIAVTAHADGPLVVSVGADGAALVWDPNLGNKSDRPGVPHNLPHTVGVRSVAASPAGAKSHLVVTGADDGRVRVWDLSNRDKLPTTPKAELPEAHTSGVQAVAISPDGRYCATAAGRDVFVWDLTEAKKLYALPGEHRDTIGSVSFTPQSTLVTASKDRTVKVWKLGKAGAAVVRTLDHRAGNLEALGVSRDGGRVLFDQDKGRVDLVDLSSGQTVGQIQNTGPAGAFGTLALFAPDEVPAGTPEDKLPPYVVATAGAEGDLKGGVQVWQTPRTGGRGSEVGRLITPRRSPVTAAAFSPASGDRFLVVGTADGGVHLWKPPAEARKAQAGRVVHVDATDTRYVTVRVEMKNDLGLLDRSSAVVIIHPR